MLSTNNKNDSVPPAIPTKGRVSISPQGVDDLQSGVEGDESIGDKVHKVSVSISDVATEAEVFGTSEQQLGSPQRQEENFGTPRQQEESSHKQEIPPVISNDGDADLFLDAGSDRTANHSQTSEVKLLEENGKSLVRFQLPEKAERALEDEGHTCLPAKVERTTQKEVQTRLPNEREDAFEGVVQTQEAEDTFGEEVQTSLPAGAENGISEDVESFLPMGAEDAFEEEVQTSGQAEAKNTFEEQVRSDVEEYLIPGQLLENISVEERGKRALDAEHSHKYASSCPALAPAQSLTVESGEEEMKQAFFSTLFSNSIHTSPHGENPKKRKKLDPEVRTFAADTAKMEHSLVVSGDGMPKTQDVLSSLWDFRPTAGAGEIQKGPTDAISAPEDEGGAGNRHSQTDPRNLVVMSNNGPVPAYDTEDPATVSNSTEQFQVQEGEFVEEDVEEVDSIINQPRLPIIPALCKRFVFGGFPSYRFAVRCIDSYDMIYEFQIDSGPSWIENAGNGAFLTFLGARQWKKSITAEVRPKKLNIIEGLIHGQWCTLKIEGEGLDSDFWKAVCEDDDDDDSESFVHLSNPRNIAMTQERLSKVGSMADESEEDEYEEFEEEDKSDGEEKTVMKTLPTLPPLSPDERIAVEYPPDQLGLPDSCVLDDYEADDGVLFSSEYLGCIDLGLYAPFLRSDRKFQSMSDIKNFIWNGLPSSYQFEFDETVGVYQTRREVADITDDLTGTPHEVARANVAMYINETGGHRHLKQSVWAKDLGDEGIHYLFHTKKIGAMKKGDIIELLICYNTSYDDVRNRQGYGRNQSINSDAHFPTYLERQFVDRFNMTEEILDEMVEMDVHRLCEALVKISNGAGEILDSFLQEAHELSSIVAIPTPQMLVALRRIDWLKPILEHRIEDMAKNWKGDSICVTEILRQCSRNVQQMGRKDWPHLLDIFERLSTQSHDLKLIWEALRREAMEEYCYKVHSNLLLPCHEFIYCGLAVDVIFDLSLAVAKHEWHFGGRGQLDDLLKAFMEIASKASACIQNPSDVNKLALECNCWKTYALENRAMVKDQMKGTMCVLTYVRGEEKVEDGCEPEPVILDDLKMDDEVLKSIIHTDFYLSRQVIFVVDAFAKRYLANLPAYSLENLCKHCGICIEKASNYLHRKLHVVGSKDCHPFFGLEYSTYLKGHRSLKNPRKSLAATSVPYPPDTVVEAVPKLPKKPTVNKFIFWNVVWVRLQEIGWTMDRGNRPGDFYICPPGIVRGQPGARNRRDVFDSIPLVRQCLEHDERFCCQPEILKLVKQFQHCEKELQKLKSKGTDVMQFETAEELVTYLTERSKL